MKFLNKLLQRYHSDDHNLIGAMEEVIESYADSKRRLDFMPYHWLPDVSSVRMVLKPWSILYAVFGIHKRDGAATMFYIRYKNGKINRYLLRTINRLRKHRGSKAYWGIAGHVLKRSNVFFLVALKHIEPRWHRDMPFWTVLKLHREYRRIALTENTNLNFKRVYIEKANGKLRGLGVPTLVWRVYLHQLNQLLVLAFDEKIQMSQHGFRPLQGTLTAWLDILKNINNFENIYEFDYKGFFPSLDIKQISKILMEYNVPAKWVNLIEEINMNIPQLTEKDLIDESDERLKGWSKGLNQMKQKLEKEEGNPLNSANWKTVFKYNEDGTTSISVIFVENPEETKEDVQIHVDKTKRAWRGFGETNLADDEFGPIKAIGVPQGAPTSPFLSILALNWGIREDAFIRDVRYADDGVRMSNGKPIVPSETEDMKKLNIKYAPEKSGWVKKEGEWVKELKFLGLVYNGERDELRAETRNGSKLIYDKQSLVELIYEGEFKKRKDYPENYGSWEAFINSSVSGFILSRLYNGNWNLQDYVQSFKLSRHPDSWVGCYNKFVKRGKIKQTLLKDLLHIKLNVFNSSSLCLQTALEALKEVNRKHNSQATNKRK